MSSISFTRRIMQIALVPAALSFTQLATAGTVVVTRPAVPIVVDRVVVPGAHYGWADVLRVSPVYGVTPAEHHQECVEEPVVVRDSPRPGSALLGAVVGGVLGNTVGKGDGRKAATVAGAVVGGAVGHGVASQDDRYYDGTERHCRMVQDTAQERRIIGYDVQYRYRGDVYASRLNYDPGERLRVRINVSPEG